MKGKPAGKQAGDYALLILWLGILSASTSPVFVRYSTCPPLVLAAYRKTIVTLMLLPVVLGRKEFRQELFSLKKPTVLWCLLSGCFLAIHFWTYFTAAANTTMAAAQVLSGMEVIVIPLFMFLTGREKYSRLGRIGIATAVAGMFLVAYTRGGFSAGNAMFGNICGLIAAVMIAGYTVIGTGVRAVVSNTVYTFVVYGAAAVVLDVLTAVSPYSFTGYGKINYLMGFLQAVFCSLLGHSIYNWALKYLGATLVSMCRIFQPVFVAVWGLLLFSEVPSWNQLVGGVIVIFGIFLYIRNKQAAENNG